MKSPIKPLVIALAASVMLNLFLFGFLSTRWFRHSGGGFDDAHDLGFRRFGMAHGMGGPGHEIVSGIMQQHHEELRAARQQLSEARRVVRSAMLAEPFDRDALQRALERMKTATQSSQLVMHQMLLDAAPKLSSEERGQLARSTRLLGDGWNGPPRPRPHDHDTP